MGLGGILIMKGMGIRIPRELEGRIEGKLCAF